MEIFNIIAGLASIVGTVFALFAWQQARQVNQTLEQEKQRLEKKITVSLQSPTHKIELPFELRRSEFARLEILGRIGMIPMKEKGKRFEIQYLNTHDFLLKVNEIIDGNDGAHLTITCEPGELDQFDLTNFQHLFAPI